MATLYVIPNWERDFENAKSRTIENATWFCVQNHFDGKKMRRLAELKNPAELYGAFHAICGIASKCWHRGVLLDTDGPLRSEDIASKTGLPVKSIDRALKELSLDVIGLLKSYEIDEVDGQWELPEAVKRWAIPRGLRRTLKNPRGLTSPAEDPREPESPRKSSGVRESPQGNSNGSIKPLPGDGVPRGLTSPAEDPREPESPRKSSGVRESPQESAKVLRREQNRREEVPPTVPQGGQEEPLLVETRLLYHCGNPDGVVKICSDSPDAAKPPVSNGSRSAELDLAESKLLLSELFGREKRKWSYEEDRLLAEIAPIPRREADLLSAWFRLPNDHPVFSERNNPHTQRKQELTTLLRDYNGELDKIQRFAPFFIESVNGQQKKEPASWRDFFRWKYGTEIILPQAFHQLDRQQREEYERDWETFRQTQPSAVHAPQSKTLMNETPTPVEQSREETSIE